MNALPQIEAFNKEWVGTDSHKRFCQWYNQTGMGMNVQGICHDHLCAGIWRAVEKYMHEERIPQLENAWKEFAKLNAETKEGL